MKISRERIEHRLQQLAQPGLYTVSAEHAVGDLRTAIDERDELLAECAELIHDEWGETEDYLKITEFLRGTKWERKP